MKENRNHGFKLRLIFGIILIALAGVVLFSLNKSTPEDLVKAGKVFDVARREDGDTQVVKVTQISSNPVATVDSGKSKLYIIEYLGYPALFLLFSVFPAAGIGFYLFIMRRI